MLFLSAAQKALLDCDVVLEVAPHPVLTPNLKQFLDTNATQVVCSLNRRIEERTAYLSALGQLYTIGVDIDWALTYKNVTSQFVKLPLYPWQEESYWQEPEERAAKRLGTGDKSLSAQGGVIQVLYFLSLIFFPVNNQFVDE